MHALFERIRRDRGSVLGLLHMYGVTDETLSDLRSATLAWH